MTTASGLRAATCHEGQSLTPRRLGRSGAGPLSIPDVPSISGKVQNGLPNLGSLRAWVLVVALALPIRHRQCQNHLPNVLLARRLCLGLTESYMNLEVRVFCHRCKEWTSQSIEKPAKPGPFKFTAVCPKCGGVISASEYDAGKKADAGEDTSECIRRLCTNPQCGKAIEAMVPIGEILPVPCPACGNTVLMGNPSEKKSTDQLGLPALGALETTVVTQEFRCSTCGHDWEQTFEGIQGTVHRVSCPNAKCPNPAVIDYVVQLDE